MRRDAIKEKIKKICIKQRIAVLATESKTGPYQSVVAFTLTDDLMYVLLSTRRHTAKYRNMLLNRKVSLLIDTRSEANGLLYKTTAIMISGKVQNVKLSEYKVLERIHLKKNPDIKSFIQQEDCVLIKIRVEKYFVVDELEKLIVVKM